MYRKRHRKIEFLSRRLLRKSYPRLHTSLILLLTGIAGFLASVVLLRLGLSPMWLRYPIAIGFAYCVFLLLLRVWLSLSRPRDWDLEDVVDVTYEVISDLPSHEQTNFGGAGDFAGGGAGGVWEDTVSSFTTTTTTNCSSSSSSGFSFDLDLEEGWFIVIAIVAIIGGALAALYVVYIAPALLAEILLDGVLLAGLYKQVKGIEHRHWLRGAVRRTVLSAILVAVFFGVAGYAMQQTVPEARSVGEVWRHLGDD